MKTLNEWLEEKHKSVNNYQKSMIQFARNFARNFAGGSENVNELCNAAAKGIKDGINTGAYDRVSRLSNAVSLYRAYQLYVRRMAVK